jgi:solute carrier family 13 (sodium-dependent dicarboxylate transporter), member 2/3/5
MSSTPTNTSADEPRLITRIFGVPLDVVGFILGLAVLVAWLIIQPSDASDAGIIQHRLAAVMLFTIIWWLTEPIPIPATGLLAVGLAVIVGAIPRPDGQSNSQALKDTLTPFADPAVFFLMGGMFIGQAMMRHGLDRRFALSILCSRWAGRSPATVLCGVGLAVCSVSMWVSNTAATAMVYPVTMGLIGVMAIGSGSAAFARSPYASALLLMTAYASSVGGIVTPIGTTTNVVAMGYFEQPGYFGRSVDFLRWTWVGVPMMAVLFLALFAWMRLSAPAHSIDIVALREHLRNERAKCGPWKRGEWNTLAVFLAAVTLWILPGVLSLANPILGELFSRHLPEEIVALLVPVMLYLLPVNWRRRTFTLAVEDLRAIDWGTLLLFGSGLALGRLLDKTGLAETLAAAGVDLLGTDELWVLIAAATVAGIVLSEFTSNAATAATMIPVVNQLCRQLNVDPLGPLMGLTFGASFGSALPISTPPNAIVYGSGLIPMRRMFRAGIVFDIVCAVVISTVLWAALQLGWSPFITKSGG